MKMSFKKAFLIYASRGEKAAKNAFEINFVFLAPKRMTNESKKSHSIIASFVYFDISCSWHNCCVKIFYALLFLPSMKFTRIFNEARSGFYPALYIGINDVKQVQVPEREKKA